MSTLTVSNVSDGSLTIPTTYVTNGSAKAIWHVTYSGGTPTLQNSVNLSSIIDSGTGFLTVNFTNATANIYYTPVFTAADSTNNDGHDGIVSNLVGSVGQRHYESGGTQTDPTIAVGTIHGDLA
jgi:hypothetical protein